MTNFDINNMDMLSAGARAHSGHDGLWSPMSLAPRDGTVIEVKNSYGVAPSFALAKWTDEDFASSNSGLEPYKHDSPRWVKVPDGGGWFSEDHLTWRPYNGSIENYIDPTGGAQDSPAYWRGAVAAKYGLPLDYFEAQTARNVEQSESTTLMPPKKRGFWARLFGKRPK